MERRLQRGKLLERTAQVLDIPAESVGLPRVEIVGRGQVRMENHRGILAYSESEVLVSGGSVLVRVEGTDLVLQAMTAEELLITGTVFRVELE